MYPWNFHSLGMGIEQARRKCANNIPANLKGLMDRWRLMHSSGDRLEILSVERERIKITIPADRIERMMRERHAREPRAVLHQNIDIFLFVDGKQLGRSVEIALRVGRAHFNLAFVIQITLRNTNGARGFEDQIIYY